MSEDFATIPPRASYRVQFNRAFRFRDAEAIVPYLAELGISHLYASPFLQASPGSTHGYDISSHERLNPEIGEPEEFSSLTGALREHGMGQIVDLVPNHMGIAEEGNRWWMDVLEHGRSSPYAAFFDIDWHPAKPELAGKVLLPILGDVFGRVLERGELRLEEEDGAFRIRYFERTLPIAPRAAANVLHDSLGRLGNAAEEERLELASIAAALANLPPRDRTDPHSVSERRRESHVGRRRLRELLRGSPGVRGAVSAAVTRINGTPGKPRSFDALEALLEEQAYRLAFWRVAAEEINYRRFFDINELAGVRVELPEVFHATHALILGLAGGGAIDGVRIDHPDGLFDPTEYLTRLARALRERSGHDLPIWVEKILTGNEELPAEWPVAGTVGYEFLNDLTGLLVAREGRAPLDRRYREIAPELPEFEEIAYAGKNLVLRSALVSELNVLTDLLNRISEQDRQTRDLTRGSLRETLRETIACFPVYRTYIDAAAGVVAKRDAEYLERAVRTARRRNPAISGLLFDFVLDTLLLRWPAGLDAAGRQERADFVMRFQQLTGPVMAKGVEDTAFYVYNRMVALNEVGGSPDRFGISIDAFHRSCARRAERSPYALNATSTHDTKRSEDVRARLAVLSEIPDRWAEATQRWMALNAPLRSDDPDRRIPSSNDEYLLYQTLVGVWPLGDPDPAELAPFAERVRVYLEKAIREAKTHTSWISPDATYERGVANFVTALLDPKRSAEWLRDFLPLQREVARRGMLNSLTQTLLKIAAPGIPDVYQGQEVWDLSLVDPDNRRPVDYARRAGLLAELRDAESEGRLGDFAAEALRKWEDGRVKLLVLHCGLELRRRHPLLMTRGRYLPQTVSGERADNVCAFGRVADGASAVVVAPVLGTERPLSGDAARKWWGDTRLRLSPELAGDYRELLTASRVDIGRGAEPSLCVGELLERFPVALLERSSAE